MKNEHPFPLFSQLSESGLGFIEKNNNLGIVTVGFLLYLVYTLINPMH
ncbi:MAG TPA: hypothetical protein DCF68_20280 [Cyanothece sp. UBA12306]|nr:hypothetical protein [Cyanothece sp. UBA12306]